MSFPSVSIAQQAYCQPAGLKWEERPAAQPGFDEAGLQQAVEFAIKMKTVWRWICELPF